MGMEEGASDMFKNLASEGKSYTSALKGFSSALAGFIDTIVETKKRLLESQENATEFAGKLAEIDFKHIMFSRTTNVKLEKLPLEARKLEIEGEQLKLKGRRLDLNLKKSQIDINRAEVGVMQAELAGKQAAYAMRQAMLSIRQIEISLKQNQFALRNAVIESGRADLDYEKKAKEIKINLLTAKKEAAEADKKYKEEMMKAYEPYVKLDEAVSKYARMLGGNKNVMNELRRDSLKYALGGKVESKFNISAAEIVDIQGKYLNELGRTIKLSGDEMVALGAMKAMFGDENTVKIQSSLANLGYDFDRTQEFAGKLFAESAKHGIAFDKVTKNFLKDIKISQTYSFSDGLSGVRRMIEQAASIDFNIENTKKLSDKLNNVENAMKVSNDLALLGGGFRMFNNPLVMLNESLSNVGKLQDRIIKMLSNLAYWDKKKGEITMSGPNKKIVKEASKIMGIDYESTMTSAMKKARRDMVSPQIDKLRIDDDLKELLKNTAQLDDNGNGYINVNGKKTSLTEVSSMDANKLANILKKETQTKSENLVDIATDFRSLKDIAEGWEKALYDNMADLIDKSGAGVSFGQHLDEQVQNGTYMKDTTQKILDTSYELLGAKNEMAKWNGYYEGATYEFQIMAADLQRDQSKYGQISAKASLDSANLQYEMAPLQFDQARIRQMQAQNTLDSAVIQSEGAQITAESAANNLAMFEDYEQPSFEIESTEGIENKKIQEAYEFSKSLLMDNIYGSVRNATRQLFHINESMKAFKALKESPFGVSVFAAANEAKDAIDKADKAEKAMKAKLIPKLKKLGKDDFNMDNLFDEEINDAEDKEKKNLDEAKINNNASDFKYKYDNGSIFTDRWSNSDFKRFANRSGGHAIFMGDVLYMDEVGKRMFEDVTSYDYGHNGFEENRYNTGCLHHSIKDYESGNFEMSSEATPYKVKNNYTSSYSAGGTIIEGSSTLNDTLTSVASPDNSGELSNWDSTLNSDGLGGFKENTGYVGCKLSVVKSKNDIQERTEKFLDNLMNNPTLINKVARFVSCEISNADNYGYKKTSKYLMHNFI